MEEEKQTSKRRMDSPPIASTSQVSVSKARKTNEKSEKQQQLERIALIIESEGLKGLSEELTDINKAKGFVDGFLNQAISKEGLPAFAISCASKKSGQHDNKATTPIERVSTTFLKSKSNNPEQNARISMKDWSPALYDSIFNS